MRNTKMRIILLLAATFVANSFLYAQENKNGSTKEGNAGDENVIVVKNFQASLSDAFKISDSPAADTTTFATPAFKYEIEPTKLSSTFTPVPIKPVKIRDDAIKKLYPGFLKMGYGNYNTSLIDFYYNALRSKTFDAGINLKHLSSTGIITGVGAPDYSNNSLSAFAIKYLDNAILSAQLNLDRNVRHFYGYNSDVTIYSKDETKNRLFNVNGDLSYASNYTTEDMIDHKIAISFYNLDGKNNFFASHTTESNINVAGFAGKHIEDNYARVNVEADFTKLDQPFLNTANNTVIRIDPRYEIKAAPLEISAGGNIEVEANTLTHYHLYPFVHVLYKVVDEGFNIWGQLTGNIRKNTFASSIYTNPFLSSPLLLINTNDKFDIRAGTDIKLDKEISFRTYGAFMRLKNDYYFTDNRILTSEPSSFSLIYDDANLINVHGELEYATTDKMQLLLMADYFGNSPSHLAKPLYKPNFTATFRANYVMQDKIIIRSDWFFTGSQFTLISPPDITLIKPTYTTIKGYLDANLAIEYRYTKVLSVFLNINNIGNVKYYTWYNYPSQRISVLAGLTYGF